MYSPLRPLPGLVASLCLLNGCSDSPASPSLPSASPGAFSLSLLQGLAPSAAENGTNPVRMTSPGLAMPTPSFSGSDLALGLGPIRNTTAFYFILGNSG